MYNVLIVADDVDAWFQVNALLRRYCIKACFITNLSAARQYIDRQNLSLLFFDKQLHGKAAFDFTSYVKSKCPQAKIILINTYVKEPAGYSKADLIISKPLIPETIERVIKLFSPQLQES
ncbi:MAG: hypothetical protein NVS3B8_09950 [Chitinophagaceae bacterium]